MRILAVCSVFMLMIGLALPAVAQNYVVNDVEVSASATNATEARATAMSQGEQEAFQRLMNDILPQDEAQRKIASAEGWQVSRMVRGYEVRNEKISGTSYRATLDVTFDPNQVLQFISGAPAAAPAVGGAPLAPTNPSHAAYVPTMPAPAAAPSAAMPTQKTVLVVPLMKQDGQTMLWEAENRWRMAWNNANRGGTTYLRLPLGDQSDTTMLSKEQAITGGASSFSLISERYQAGSVLVAEAELHEHAEPLRLDVTLRSLAQNGEVETLELSYDAPYEEDANQLMARAAQDLASRLVNQGQSTYSETNQYQQQEASNRVTVLTKLTRLTDWVTVRKRLQSLPAVERVELAAISSQQADIVLHYRGKPEALASSMTAQGLQVEQAYNYWVVSY